MLDDETLFGGRTRQPPISLKWQTGGFWGFFAQEFFLSPTGTAIAFDLYFGSSWHSYSRSAEHYSRRVLRYRNPLYTFQFVVAAMDRLSDMGWIDHDRAPPGRFEWQSAACPKPALFDALGRIIDGRLMLVKPAEAIWLRDRGTRQLIDYRDNRQTERRRRLVEELNEAIMGANLPPAAAAPIVCIYTDNFGQNGRFYGLGNCFQNMPLEIRKLITICGESVVELDFRTIHPALLYARAGAAPPSDCYSVRGFSRALAKLGLLVLINARNEASARRAIATSDPMKATAPASMQVAFGAAQRLIDQLKNLHSRIAWAFHCDMGLELMAQDAAIAAEVIRTMLARGIVVLPIHDSFLVPASKASELEAAMIEASQKVASVTLKVEAK